MKVDLEYARFADRLAAGGILRDPWIDGSPRFRLEPVVVSAPRYAELGRAAEETAAACHALASLLGADARLLDEGLGLTPVQRALWAVSAPAWHGIARTDVFVTATGLAVAEINCDTPTGEAEAVVLGALTDGDDATFDPNRTLRERFLAMLAYVARRERSAEAGPARVVGVVYPTELTDDLPLVRLYRRWLEDAGFAVVLGSPYNLTFDGRRARLFDEPVDVLVRHYKTDWWGERESVWRDCTVADAAPLEGPLRAMLAAMAAGTLAVINPLGSVALQNKRAFALLWEHLGRLPPEARAAVERYIPLTRRLEVMHAAELIAQREDWVIKSDYGAEGEEVLVGRDVDAATWRLALDRARPRRWVAQRRFAPETDAEGAAVNYGVYLVGGRASGLYARVQAGATDARAMSAAARVQIEPGP